MKDLAPALAAHLASREPITAHLLVWFNAVAAAGGAAAPWGVWTGDDDRVFTVDGSARLYIGGGAMGNPGTLTHEAGYVVRLFRVPLSHLHPGVRAALDSTNLRGCAVDVHQVHLQPGSHDLVADPVVKFRGQFETLVEPRLAKGSRGMAEVQLTSSARDMTRGIDLTKSDAALRSVHPSDGFRRYNVVSGRVTTKWGEA